MMKNFTKFMALTNLIFNLGCATSGTMKEQTPAALHANAFFEISHSFETDKKTIFKMWTDPKHFSNWLGPTGAKMSFLKINVKEGETSLWIMTTPDGLTKYGKINYKIISPHNHLLVYTQNFCDKDGAPAKLPISAPYPDILLTTVKFFDEEKNRTKVTVKWEVFSDATEAERKTFREMKTIVTNGWNQSFEKLEALFKLKEI
jgi:uncharacterized protein YndB with AHSA1/START domain